MIVPNICPKCIEKEAFLKAEREVKELEEKEQQERLKNASKTETTTTDTIRRGT